MNLIRYRLVGQVLVALFIPIGLVGLILGYGQAADNDPYMVKDINLNGDSAPYYPVDVEGILYFFADDGQHGAELWKSDGTVTGTVMVKDINPTAGSMFTGRVFPVGIDGVLYFTADDGQHGAELWKSDGTMTGTVMIKDIYPNAQGSEPRHFAELNGLLYFSASNPNHGRELWSSDGTLTGTILITDINPGPDSGFQDYSHIVNAGNILYFSLDTDNEIAGLWATDGSAAGTTQLKKDLALARSSVGNDSNRLIVEYNGNAYFSLCESRWLNHHFCSIGGFALWKSDGTVTGTVIIHDEYIIDELIRVGDTLYFKEYRYLWKSNGTAGSPDLVKFFDTVDYPYPNSSPFSWLTDVNGTLFFQGNDGVDGWELWKSDGTLTGTVMVKDYDSGAWTNIVWLTAVKEKLFFTAYDSHGNEVWGSDGTLTGTTIVSDINPGIASSLTDVDPYYPSYPIFTSASNRLYFGANDGENGFELWALDVPEVPIKTHPGEERQIYLPVVKK